MTANKLIKKGGVLILILLFAYVSFYIGVNFVNPQKTIPTFGYKLFVVKTDSMEPVMKQGSVAFVIKANSNNLKEDDIIVVGPRRDILIAHYLAEQFIDENNQLVIKTRPFGAIEKDEYDYWHIHRQDLIGKVVFSIPVLGYIVGYLQSGIGIITTIADIILLFVFFWVLNKPVKEGVVEG